MDVSKRRKIDIKFLPVNKDQKEQLSPKIHTHRKVILDCIHGTVKLHPLLLKIIDTPEFQRLRHISQLGGVSWVYPGAVHTRFEHSIGVCYLGGKLVRKLSKNQPELGINDTDVLCVEIAGLCHDLGHGPFSHMFDARFIPKAVPCSPWKHEDGSVMMFKHLFKKYEAMFTCYDLHDEHLTFICNMIQGKHDSESDSQSGCKRFLYDIICNKRNGIDVDKWDYFARDYRYLGMDNSFDHNYLMNFVRVLKDDSGELHICTRDKEVMGLYNMFHTRRELHRIACKHKVTVAVEMMVCDAMLKANDIITFRDRNGVPRSISESITAPDAYLKLTDHVYYEILYSNDNRLEEARNIIERIERRDLYKCIGETKPKEMTNGHSGIRPELEKEKLPRYAEQIASMDREEFTKDDWELDIVEFNYGKGDQNPMNGAYFYTKDNPQLPIKLHESKISCMLPKAYREQYLRAYCKKPLTAENGRRAVACFKRWCINYSMEEPWHIYKTDGGSIENGM